ncbi:Uncharacterised protein [uncultured archaeon]|nr:Uncharacterised protein [uncultured archaeon]
MSLTLPIINPSSVSTFTNCPLRTEFEFNTKLKFAVVGPSHVATTVPSSAPSLAIQTEK